MMRPKQFIYFLLILLVMISCQSDDRKKVIGVSQCSEDSWRQKLESELRQATYLDDEVELRILSANDDVEAQRKQIEDLVDDNVDLLIVSPQQTSSLSSAIKKATQKNIPVILFDRKSDVEDYTAYMGADNYAIGQMLGQYVAAQLGNKGKVVEIAGEHASSPAQERHRGFLDALKAYPEVQVVGSAEGNWKQESGEKAMRKILAEYDGGIDCVFGGNDRMTLGARAAIEQHKQIHPESPLVPGKIFYVGVDALPTNGGGIEKICNGQLTASAIYPTRGDELIALAKAILNGEPYNKINTLETSIVTDANARVLLMQYKEVEKQDEEIKKMHTRVDRIMSVLGWQRLFLWFAVAVTIVVSILLAIAIRENKAKQRLNSQLRHKNDELNHAKEQAERQRDELEEQRDKLLDMTTRHTDDDSTADNDTPQTNEFHDRFFCIVNEKMGNPDLSVEDIGQELFLSRVQLYRKVKSMTGKTPVEIIREERLKRARILLSDSSLSVSEVAYKVGFSAPSYFTKCYKDYYGIAPSAKKK